MHYRKNYQLMVGKRTSLQPKERPTQVVLPGLIRVMYVLANTPAGMRKYSLGNVPRATLCKSQHNSDQYVCDSTFVVDGVNIKLDVVVRESTGCCTVNAVLPAGETAMAVGLSVPYDDLVRIDG